MRSIEFYFDLGSPYSYLGFYQIQKIAEQYKVEIVWKPILLGSVFNATGNHSPLVVPAKASYTKVDLMRWSKLWNIPFKLNPYFPINSLRLMRFITAIQLFQPEKFKLALHKLFEVMFEKPRNLNDIKEIILIGGQLGFSPLNVEKWLEDEYVKKQLNSITNEAIRKGVFGAPTWFIGNEMYWGVDHLFFIEKILSSKLLN